MPAVPAYQQRKTALHLWQLSMSYTYNVITGFKLYFSKQFPVFGATDIKQANETYVTSVVTGSDSLILQIHYKITRR